MTYRLRKLARRNKTALSFAGVILFFMASLGAGVGWIVRDRVARKAQVANDLEMALERAELFQGQGKRAEALAALDAVELLSGQAPTDPVRGERIAALKERLAAEARDQEFIARFEEVRLRVQSQVNVEESRFRFSTDAAFPEIEEALRRYGIEIGVMAPAGAAACVQERPEQVRRDLVAALDVCLSRAPKGDAQTRQWLLATLAAADKDAWRVRVRKARVDGDGRTLERMARDADVQMHPPSLLLLVARDIPAPMSATRLELLRRIQRAYPADLWANHSLAHELTENGHSAEAIRYYTAALALRPDNPGIYLNRGSALTHAGEVDAAIADYRQATALAPQYAEPHYNLGIALQDKGLVDEAITEYRQAIRLKKGSTLLAAMAHTNLGLCLRTKGLVDDAIAEYREAIRNNKDVPEAHSNLGNVLHIKGQLDDAIAEYREAIRLDPKDPKPWSNRGKAYHDLGQPDKALADYSKAIELDPKNALAWNNRGFVYLNLRQYDKAIDDYSQAIKLDSKYVLAWRNRGIAYSGLGQPDKAVADYTETIRLNPNDALAWTYRGMAYVELHQYDKAIADLNKAIELTGQSAMTTNNLAWLLATCPDERFRDAGKAVALAKKAVEMAPKEGAWWNTLGTAHYRAGSWKEAVAALEKSMELRNGGDSFDWFFLAMAHWQLGDKEKARTRFDQAVQWMEKNQPKNDELRRFRAEAEELLKMEEKKK